MNKRSIFTALAALLVLATGCKQDENTVTLGMAVENPSKVYIDSDRYPCWIAGDQVYVNNQPYTIGAISDDHHQTSVTVTENNDYYAIYPAAIVASGTTLSGSITAVTLPETQWYEKDGQGHQIVKVPMGAYTSSSENFLHFKNLCSIVRVNVTNPSTTTAMEIEGITISTDGTDLCGTGTTTFDNSTNTYGTISITSGFKEVILTGHGVMETIAANSSKSFDIVVPTFTGQKVSIKVGTPLGFQVFTQNNVSLNSNVIATVNVSVNNTATAGDAYLVDGYTFNYEIPTNATAVEFRCNCTTYTSGTELSTSVSPVKIWGNLVESDNGNVKTWVVSTSCSTMYANPDCSYMFDSDQDYSTPDHQITSITFGTGFNTDHMVNMEDMFKGCGELTTITGLDRFNTTNVIHMYGAFQNCSTLTSINISNFNTANTQTMEYMFSGCTRLISITFPTTNYSNQLVRMGSMFFNCSALTSLDLSHFNTTNVDHMESLFNGCSALSSINLYGTDFTIGNNVNTDQMCASLPTCTIYYYNDNVKTKMEASTGFPTANITFTKAAPSK